MSMSADVTVVKAMRWTNSRWKRKAKSDPMALTSAGRVCEKERKMRIERECEIREGLI